MISDAPGGNTSVYDKKYQLGHKFNLYQFRKYKTAVSHKYLGNINAKRTDLDQGYMQNLCKIPKCSLLGKNIFV